MAQSVTRRHRKPLRLTSFLWRYLLSSAVAAILIAIVWWSCLIALITSGFVLPANTAEREVFELLDHIHAQGTFSPEQASHTFRWAMIRADGALLEHSGMSDAQLALAMEALHGSSFSRSFPYTQYHRWAQLADGTTLILQYDYAAQYADARLNLPDFQLSMLVLLVLLELAAAAANTFLYARTLKAETRQLSSAVDAIAHQRLDVPFCDDCRIAELKQLLHALEILRVTLSDSLHSQWTLRQQTDDAAAALADALATPLSIISGQAELLQEDLQSTPHTERIAAILRETEVMQKHIAALQKRTSDAPPFPAP